MGLQTVAGYNTCAVHRNWYNHRERGSNNLSLDYCDVVGRMPEFRFRRKKRQQQTARRHSLHDTEKTQAQVTAAREMVEREEVRGGGGGGE